MTTANIALKSCIDDSFIEILDAIEINDDEDIDISNRSVQIEKLAAFSRYNVLRVSPGLCMQDVPLNDIERVFDVLDEVVGAFTDQSKCERVRDINCEDAHIVMVSWLSELISYFGKPVLLDAEVILLTLSDFGKLSMEFQYKYFECTLSKVRKWFKILRKKLKPFCAP
jgi:hypothetical protein